MCRFGGMGRVGAACLLCLYGFRLCLFYFLLSYLNCSAIPLHVTSLSGAEASTALLPPPNSTFLCVCCVAAAFSSSSIITNLEETSVFE